MVCFKCENVKFRFGLDSNMIVVIVGPSTPTPVLPFTTVDKPIGFVIKCIWTTKVTRPCQINVRASDMDSIGDQERLLTLIYRVF